MGNRKLLPIVVILGAILIIGFSSMYRVFETEQAIVLEFGRPIRTVKDAGLHFKLPWQSVTFLDKRILNLDTPAQEIITSDQKRVIVDAFARFQIADPLKVRQSVGNASGAANRLETIVNSTIRKVLGSAPFTAILSPDRLKLLEDIRTSVNQAASSMGINVVDVRIKRADLPEANSEAIFRRMRTEREREAKEARAQGAEQAQRIRSTADKDRTVLIAEAQRDADIIRGEGEGKAVKIFADAFSKDPDFFAFYRSMQAYAKALAPDDTTLVLSPNSEFFRYLDSLKGTPGSKK